MTGLVVRALARPDVAKVTIRMAAFGSSREADWTLVAHHLVGTLLGHLEPDPEVRWDANRLKAGLDAFEATVQAAIGPR